MRTHTLKLEWEWRDAGNSLLPTMPRKHMMTAVRCAIVTKKRVGTMAFLLCSMKASTRQQRAGQFDCTLPSLDNGVLNLRAVYPSMLIHLLENLHGKQLRNGETPREHWNFEICPSGVDPEINGFDFFFSRLEFSPTRVESMQFPLCCATELKKR